MDDSRRSLIWHGMFLFLLGLLTGFVETKFANPRMGLAAHLEGVMNGTFLIALGAVWMEVRLPLGVKAAAYWFALYGAYVNWVATALGAALGAAAAFSNYRRGTPRTALARDIDDRVVYVGRAGDRRVGGADTVGIAAQRRCLGGAAIDYRSKESVGCVRKKLPLINTDDTDPEKFSFRSVVSVFISGKKFWFSPGLP